MPSSKPRSRLEQPGLVDLVTFPYRPEQRERFRRGDLRGEWAEWYDDILFDDLDLKNARNQESLHFWEWAAAVLLYESLGLRSLIQRPLSVDSVARTPHLYTNVYIRSQFVSDSAP